MSSTAFWIAIAVVVVLWLSVLHRGEQFRVGRGLIMQVLLLALIAAALFFLYALVVQ